MHANTATFVDTVLAASAAELLRFINSPSPTLGFPVMFAANPAWSVLATHQGHAMRMTQFQDATPGLAAAFNFFAANPGFTGSVDGVAVIAAPPSPAPAILDVSGALMGPRAAKATTKKARRSVGAMMMTAPDETWPPQGKSALASYVEDRILPVWCSAKGQPRTSRSHPLFLAHAPLACLGLARGGFSHSAAVPAVRAAAPAVALRDPPALLLLAHRCATRQRSAPHSRCAPNPDLPTLEIVTLVGDRTLPAWCSVKGQPNPVSLSLRIFAACALLAVGASRLLMMALCRWKCEASLDIYTRLKPEDYVHWVRRMAHAKVKSLTTRNIPEMDHDALARAINAI